MARTLRPCVLLVGLTAGLRRGVSSEDNEPVAPQETEVEIWDQLTPNASDVLSEVTAQWSPCALGMCWKSWGKYRDSRYAGVGGRGNSGCRGVFKGCGSSHFMDCFFGPCPLDFATSGQPCISTSNCRSYCDVQHAGSCRYSGPTERTSYSTWMREFHSKKLNTLMMVEAHHYLAKLGTLDFYKPVKSSEEILKKLNPIKNIPGAGDIMRVAYASLLPMWSSCQSSDTTTLLNRGVRAFDIRPYLAKSSNSLRDSHGGRGLEVEPALRSIASFVRANPSEIVFVQLKNVMSGDGSCLDCKSKTETIQSINKAVERAFGTCGGGTLLCNVNFSKTVGELVQAGNVIVHTNNWDVYGGSGSPRRIHWSGSMYKGSWYNTNSLTKLKSSVLDDRDAQSKARGSNHMIAHQWILSPTSNDFVGAISQRFTGEFQGNANPHGCQSLACFGKVASAQAFRSFYQSVRGRYQRSNFLMLDFADRPGTMDFILWANRNYAK